MNEEKNLKMIVEYDGSRYHGWQRQRKDATIQAVIEDRIQIMVGEQVRLIGSGRTDAGVHALHQVCNFITRSEIGPDSIRRGLNSLLPEDIFISHAEYVSLDFHSRYNVKSKTYEYRVLNRKEVNVFLRNYTWHVKDFLDLKEIRRCMTLLIGKHDFSAFRSSGSNNKNPVREMIRAEINGPERGVIIFLFEAEGFLRHMVRNIMGTIVEVGKGNMHIDEFEKIFRSKDRRNAGIKAPPQGLFLKKVNY
jgi:tRNA pseudouridine38-40 synthase